MHGMNRLNVLYCHDPSFSRFEYLFTKIIVVVHLFHMFCNGSLLETHFAPKKINRYLTKQAWHILGPLCVWVFMYMAAVHLDVDQMDRWRWWASSSRASWAKLHLSLRNLFQRWKSKQIVRHLICEEFWLQWCRITYNRERKLCDTCMHEFFNSSLLTALSMSRTQLE